MSEQDSLDRMTGPRRRRTKAVSPGRWRARSWSMSRRERAVRRRRVRLVASGQGIRAIHGPDVTRGGRFRFSLRRPVNPNASTAMFRPEVPDAAVGWQVGSMACFRARPKSRTGARAMSERRRSQHHPVRMPSTSPASVRESKTRGPWRRSDADRLCGARALGRRLVFRRATSGRDVLDYTRRLSESSWNQLQI